METFIQEKKSYNLSIFIYIDTGFLFYKDITHKHKWAMLLMIYWSLVFIILSLFSFWGVSWLIKSANNAHTIGSQVRGNYLKEI